MEKFYKIKNDSVFKTIFCKKENRDLLKRLIEEVIKEDVKIVSIKVPELPKNNVSVKGKILDVLVETCNGEVNIELNSYSDIFLRKRNAAYIFKRYSDSVKVGKSYQNMPKFIQINLTSYSEDTYKNIPLNAKYQLCDKDNNLCFIENLTIYEINLRKAMDLCYNGSEVSLLGMLDMNYEELSNLKGDKLVEKLKENVFKLNYDDDAIRLMSDEDEERLLKNSFIQVGLEQGAEQKTIEIAKMMLKENADDSFILKVTGLTNEELEKLKNN